MSRSIAVCVLGGQVSVQVNCCVCVRWPGECPGQLLPSWLSVMVSFPGFPCFFMQSRLSLVCLPPDNHGEKRFGHNSDTD